MGFYCNEVNLSSLHMPMSIRFSLWVVSHVWQTKLLANITFSRRVEAFSFVVRDCLLFSDQPTKINITQVTI